jgi:peptide/nickel transport system ATP-binding protein
MHPYTKGLLTAIPVPKLNYNKERIILKGEISSPVNPKPGCRFASRCDYCTAKCHEVQPEYVEVAPEHFVACHNVKEINNL